jgi:hypothetical protein
MPIFNLQLKNIIDGFFFSIFKNKFLNKNNLDLKKNRLIEYIQVTLK